eukprot:147091_1
MESHYNSIIASGNLRNEVDNGPKTFIITGASENHHKSMMRTAVQIAEKMSDYNIELILVDLGLRQESKDRLFSEGFMRALKTRGANFNVTAHKFEFEKYPGWISDRLLYAWKPLVIKEIVEKFGAERLLWIDSGCSFNEKLSPKTWNSYLNVLSTNGVALPELETIRTIGAFTHPGMLEYFMVSHSSSILEKPQFAACIIGIDLRVKNVKSGILDPWFDCASKTKCLAPKGSSLHNHRYDQAALSIILRQGNWPEDKKLLHESYRFIAVHRDMD